MGFGEFNIYVMPAGIMKSCYNFNAERKNGLILYCSQLAWFTEYSKKLPPHQHLQKQIQSSLNCQFKNMWSLCDTDMRPDHTVRSPALKNNSIKSADMFSFIGD